MKFIKELFASELSATVLKKQVELNKRLSIRGISTEIGIGHSTFYRALNSKPLDIDSILCICQWINRPITDFIK